MRPALFLVLLLPLLGARAEAPVTLAATEGYPNTYVEDGQTKGFFVDLVREAFRRGNRAVDIRIQPWLRSIEGARYGHVDGMFVIFHNADREAYFDYPTEPLAKFPEAVFVRAGTPAKFNLDQPSTRRIAIVNHSYHGPKVDPALHSGRFPHLIEANDYDTLTRMLAAGRVDVVIAVADPVLESIAKLKLGDKIKRLPDLDQVPVYLVFTKERDMGPEKKEFEEGIRSMRADGSYETIARKYRK